MEIRRRTERDDMLEVIRKAVESVEPESYSEEDQRHLEEVIPEMSVGFAEKERYVYFVAVEESEILGVAGLQKESGGIGGLFVHPEHMGEGIGSKLLEKLEEKALEEGIDEMTSLASLEAVDFYSKNGYRPVEEEERDMEGRKIRVLKMKKEL